MNDIGGILTRLAPLIEKKVRTEVNLIINLQQEAQKLSSTLIEIQKLLQEAENRRLTDPRVKAWLEKLEEITYEIDDELDRFETANIQHQIEGQPHNDEDGDDSINLDNGLWEKVCAFVESICLAFRHVCKRRNIALSIKGLNEKVDGLAKETAKYSMIPIINDYSTSAVSYMSEKQSAFSEVCPNLESQEKVKNSIVKKLVEGTSSEVKSFLSRLGEEIDDSSLQVISLVGLGGIGKTTVARLVYHDKSVDETFGLKAWVWVSSDFDEIRVARAILESLGVNSQHVSEFQGLLKLIKLSLIEAQMKFLLVLDDVWIQDDEIWKQIKASLSYGAPGSRILVTTRNENVARLMGSTGTILDRIFGPQQIIPVEPLSDEDCESLFEWFAFGGGSYDDEKQREIGWRLAKKCRGLAIAAKALGNYLQSRKSQKLWEKVLEKEIWELEQVSKPIFDSFAFSYNELPLALKQCFSYCSIFPKEDLVEGSIDVNELLRIWAVQGYLGSTGIDNEMELKGLEYVEKLATCSLLKVNMNLPGNRIMSCRMNGLLHDFTRYLVKTSRGKNKRSFFSKQDLLLDGILSLKSARVLSLTGENVSVLPPNIGDLIHLRLLNLYKASVEKLPDSMCKLCNLQSLDLRRCDKLSNLPEDIHKLRNLRLLLIEDTNSLDLRGLRKLAWVQTLDKFHVRSRADLRYLRKLNQLQGSLCITIEITLNENEDVVNAKKADLKDKKNLTNLTFEFRRDVSLDVMEALQIPPNLQCLYFKYYRGVQFPSWIIGSFLSKLRVLEVLFSENCSCLPAFGTLPSLEELNFNSIKSLKSISLEFLGILGRDDFQPSLRAKGFPKLRRLSFFNCKEWEEWNDISQDEETSPLSIMPRLESLTIYECHKLKELPHRLLHKASSLRFLSLQKSSLLSKHYKREDWPQIRYVTID